MGKLKLFLLYENAAGLALFSTKKYKPGKTTVEDVLKLFNKKKKFLKKVKMTAFQPFIDSNGLPDAQMALSTL